MRGVGYIHVGPLPMPTKPVWGASSCYPPDGAADGSLHFLATPGGGRIMMRWHAITKEWSPLTPLKGSRIGYTAVYLAAHGWSMAP